MNPNQDSNYNVGGIYIGNAAGNIDTYQNDHTQNIILGGGAEADISINTIFQGTGVNNRAQNQNNTIVNSNGITLSSWSQYDVQKNFIVNSKDLNISAQYAGGAGSGADVHGNSFINCSGMTSNARLKGNTFLNFTGTLPNSGDGGIQNNLIIGRFNVETYLDMRPGSDNNIVGNGNSFTIQGDGNLMFGVSNNKIWNSGNSNLVFGQNQSVGQESGSTRAQRSLIFGFNQTVATQNQIQNSIIAGQGNELKNSSINSNINNSIAVGQNLEGNTSNAAYFGKNNNPTTIANHPELFVVGCGQGTGARRNALAVLEKKNNTAYGRGVVMMEQTVMANFADDAAAGVGGLEIGAIYHTNGTLKIKIS